RNIIILSDEVYENLHYTASFPRMATLSAAIAARTISIASVGKAFNATGWRVGHAIGHESLITHVKWAHVLLSYVASGPAQEAAAVAYEEADHEAFYDSNREFFRHKVDNLCHFLDELGLSVCYHECMGSSMSLPHLLLIPGFWEGTSVYDSVISSLQAHGYSAQAIPLSSTGHASPGNPSMKDDVAFIRGIIAPLVEEEEKDVLLVLHSAGGFLGPMAIEGLSHKEREARGKKGGVVKIVFLSGAIWKEGYMHCPLPFFDYQVTETSFVPVEACIRAILAVVEGLNSTWWGLLR
ncbi:MAG: hypothetical protein Q9225_007971, partial [Loekoesia sp. 1 TL-2023]